MPRYRIDLNVVSVGLSPRFCVYDWGGLSPTFAHMPAIFGCNLRMAKHLFKQRPCMVRHCYRKVMLYQKVSKQHFNFCYLCVGIGGDKQCHRRLHVRFVSTCLFRPSCSPHFMDKMEIINFRIHNEWPFLGIFDPKLLLIILDAFSSAHRLSYPMISTRQRAFEIFPLAFPIW